MAALSETVSMLGFSKAEQSDIISKLSNQSGGNIVSILKSTVSASAFSIVMLVLVPVYAVLILYHRQYWMKIFGVLVSFRK